MPKYFYALQNFFCTWKIFSKLSNCLILLHNFLYKNSFKVLKRFFKCKKSFEKRKILNEACFDCDFQILWLRGWIIHFLIVVLQIFLDGHRCHVFNIFWTFELTAWLTRVSVTLYTCLISSAIEQQFCTITFIRQNDGVFPTTILIWRATKHLVNQSFDFFQSSFWMCMCLSFIATKRMCETDFCYWGKNLFQMTMFKCQRRQNWWSFEETVENQVFSVVFTLFEIQS